MLRASSAAAWSCVLAHGSTLISVGLGFLAQTYTHIKKSQACMQTDEQKHKDTYEHGRQGEDGDGAGRVSRPGERDRQKERDAGRAGLSGETESVDTKGGLYCSCSVARRLSTPQIH